MRIYFPFIKFIQTFYIICDSCISNALSKSNKVRILTYKICFATYANNNTCFIIISCFCNYYTFFGFTVTSFCSYFLTLFAQPVNSCFKITIGFC